MRELADRAGGEPEHRRGRLPDAARARGDRDGGPPGQPGAARAGHARRASTSGSRCRRACGTSPTATPIRRCCRRSAEAFAAAAAAGATGRRCCTGRPPSTPELARLARAGLDADGVPDGPVAVTSGSLDAIERVLAAHLQARGRGRGRGPGLGQRARPRPGARAARRAGRRGRRGAARPTTCERALEAGARALVVTDRAQNPTGAAVSAARARELRAVLAAPPRGAAHRGRPRPRASSTCRCTRWPGRTRPLGLRPLRRQGVRPRPAARRAHRRRRSPSTGCAGRQRLGPGWVSRLLQRAVVAAVAARRGGRARPSRRRTGGAGTR